MSLLLPIDDNGMPIEVLGFAYRGTQTVAVGAASTRTQAIPHDIRLITLISTDICRFEIGDATVTADRAGSPVLFPGQYVDLPIRTRERFVAFASEAADCQAYVIGRI